MRKLTIQVNGYSNKADRKQIHFTRADSEIKSLFAIYIETDDSIGGFTGHDIIFYV